MTSLRSPAFALQLRSRSAALFPGSRILSLRPLGESTSGGTEKATGYGRPLRVDLELAGGELRQFVFHVAQPNEFGHDRRSDRAADALLTWDAARSLPKQAAVLDVGAMTPDRFVPLQDSDEFYTITEYAEGVPYADSLSAIGRRGTLTTADLERTDALADYLVDLHAEKIDSPTRYRRAVRDLIGHGEGVFGLVDSFPDNVPGASLDRIDALERRCVFWRRSLHGRTERLCRTHGDFHPFNILFQPDGELLLLDASRGCAGDPADDATCLAVNYLFFGSADLQAAGLFRRLWDRFWERYLGRTGDEGLLSSAPPYLAWRVLVLVNPLWYPNVSEATRDALLRLAEGSLDAGRLDLDDVQLVFQ